MSSASVESTLYEQLNDSLLLDKRLIADEFRSVSDAGLQIALEAGPFFNQSSRKEAA